MRFIADLHIHSCYSRATSKASRLPGLAAWAAIKGINVLGTGDFTHPGWLQHLGEYLEPAEPGFFKLRQWSTEEIAALVPEGVRVNDLPIHKIRFVLSAEISSIYKKDGKVRKIHNILFAPDFSAVRRINHTLAGIGNIESDGRPILGLDARDLLEIVLENGPGGFLVPAHIWTPWFSLFGSKSGFDALEDCFGDLSAEIFALETGLSSDPDMNRCISSLDRFTLISNSDCHSPAKLGREANIFDTEFNFAAMHAALRSPVDRHGKQVFSSTVEFYPEEGKYHCDGHRKCHACLDPHETIENKGLCPVCNKPVTVGVLHRVMELADRDAPVHRANSPAVHSLIPLSEILSELLGVGPSSKKVMRAYGRLISEFSSEFNLLLHASKQDIDDAGSPLLAEAIDRVRSGRVIRKPGYDGEFGVIRVFAEDELSRLAGQLNLFGEPAAVKKKKGQRQGPAQRKPKQIKKKTGEKKKSLNSAQQAAVTSSARYILVQAGPGTGKTHTLVSRIIQRIKHNPDPTTVITFTNKAAGEIRERLDNAGLPSDSVFVSTLHGYCLHYLRLRDPLLRVAGPEMQPLLLHQLFPALDHTGLAELCQEITDSLQQASRPDKQAVSPMVKNYFTMLDGQHLVDLEAIIPCTLGLLKQNTPFSKIIRQGTGSLHIDEFQDVNGVQYELVKTLSQSSSVFAIGDPDQAIYGFRGADPKWFYQFMQDLSPDVHNLNYNYRCDKHILKAAAHVIANNQHSGEEATPLSSDNGQVVLQKFSSSFAEARFVAEQIEELLGGTSHRQIEALASEANPDFSLKDIGVLYRTTRQAKVIADVLFKQGIPYQIVDLEAFYQKEPAKILFSWLLVAANLADLAHFLFLYSLERGIGKTTLGLIEDALGKQASDPLAVLAALDKPSNQLRETTATFQGLARGIRALADKDGVAASMGPILKYYNLSEDDVEIQRFLRLAGALGNSLPEFGEYLLQNSHTVSYDDKAEAVTLMTLHAAKGVEFPVVFLVGVEEGLLPLQPRDALTEADLVSHLEEERRLFFVGLTRAKHQVYLSWSTQGNGFSRSGTPSPFMREIPESLLLRSLPKKKKRPRHKQLTLFPHLQ